MKKIVYWVGILFLTIVFCLNLFFSANLDVSEHITINTNSYIYIIGLVLVGVLIYGMTKKINEKIYKDSDFQYKKNFKKYLLIASLITYIIFNIIWIIVVRPPVVGDQIHICNLAQTFYRGNLEEFLPNMTYAGIPLSEYMQLYHQQIPLAFVYNVFFNIIHFDTLETLRVLNFIGNIFIVIALYKIVKQLDKKYKTNKILFFTLILTFISLPMLSTFIYGDIPSLALCLFSVYFMMKYTETQKVIYPICSSLFTMIAYMMRMNSLIFIIATVIYLLLNIFEHFTEKNYKNNIINIIVIILYIVISIIPSTLVKNYWLDKYNMPKDKGYPTISYILMAMEESPRGNGWYNESIAEPAQKNPEKAQKEYVDRIKNRLVYFSQNIGYTFDFYTMKIASMWTENTYSAVRSNLTQENDPLENFTVPLTFYQKVLLMVTCLCCLINIIQNRKNLSLDIIFLVTIFIGGFAFHILWEAKSRYIIPYVVILIPIASVCINQSKIKECVSEIISKVKPTFN